MPKYEVMFITKLSKYVGTFEADDENRAIEMASLTKEYQRIGGICHQCTDNVGDDDGGEFVAFKEDENGYH